MRKPTAALRAAQPFFVPSAIPSARGGAYGSFRCSPESSPPSEDRDCFSYPAKIWIARSTLLRSMTSNLWSCSRNLCELPAQRCIREDRVNPLPHRPTDSLHRPISARHRRRTRMVSSQFIVRRYFSGNAPGGRGVSSSAAFFKARFIP